MVILKIADLLGCECPYLRRIIDTREGVGVIVTSPTGDTVLCGIRDDNRQIGGAGGHIEHGETPKQAAIRETQEEFGITPLDLRYLGKLKWKNAQYCGVSHIFCCRKYKGKLGESDEMTNLMWLSPDKLVQGRVMGKDVYKPLRESLRLFGARFDEDDWITMNGASVRIGEDGTIKGGLGGKYDGQNVSEVGSASDSFNELMGTEYTGVSGQAAVDKLMQEKQGHVKDAFYHEEVGGIDVFYGDDGAGLRHISKRHGKKFTGELASVIANGSAFPNKDHPGERINIAFRNKIAVISFDIRGTETTALLTAFETKR